MEIPKELIEKAKEKLGDDNWRIILENLGIYSEKAFREKKALCPFHSEDTPSFCYNDKKYYGHCFGCSTNCDVVDSYMHTGMTFIQACRALFEAAEIPFAFTEEGVRTQPTSYRYPTVPSKDNDRSKIIAYWKMRKISVETLDALDVRSDGHDNSVFITYDTNDVATVVKYKPINYTKHGNVPKMWFQPGADKADLLFNMNRINTSMPLVVAEGEGDCLSVYEAGYHNVITPLNGASSYGWIGNNIEWLEQFDKIIVCGDHDGPGQHMNQEVQNRLGSWRVSVINMPEEYTDKETSEVHSINDVNQFLYWAGKEAVLDAILNAKDSEIPSLVNFSDIDELDVADIPGIRTGFAPVDKVLTRLFFANVVILAGRAGSGKSSFTNALIANAIEQGYPVWLFSGEMKPEFQKSWLVSQLAGRRHIKQFTSRTGDVFYKADSAVKPKINKWMDGMLYMYKDDYSRDEKDILQSMEDSARKYGSKLFILDNLTIINLPGGNEGKFEAQKAFMAKLINFSTKYNVAVLLCAHLRKRMAGESYSEDASLDAVAGSSDLTNLAHRTISLRRVTKKEKEDLSNEYSNYDVVLTVSKDRMQGRIDVSIPLHYDIPSRRFYTSLEELDRQYKWDTAKYTDPLPVPKCLLVDKKMDQEADKEVFGA